MKPVCYRQPTLIPTGAYATRGRAYAEDGADMVADQVRDQPLIAIGVAAAVGFLLGRITK